MQVRMVKHKYTGNVYALKIMRKELIVRHGQQEHVKNERAVMQQLKVLCHLPFGQVYAP